MILSTPTALVAAAPSLLRQGLVATLHTHWPRLHLTLTADVGQVAQLLNHTAFGLLVLDAALAGPTLPQLLAQVHRHRPDQPVLLLADQPATAHSGRSDAPGQALRLSRQVGPQTLVVALSAWLTTPTATTGGSCCQAGQAEPFSRRELQVLRLMVDDQCNEEIADHLCLSVRTVESHRRTLIRKAGTRTLVGLAVRAVREGWVA